MELEICQKQYPKELQFFSRRYTLSYSNSKGCLHGSDMFLANVKTKISN